MLGSLWLSWAVYCDGTKWTGPILLPNSDNLMYNTPAVAALPGGGLARRPLERSSPGSVRRCATT